MASLLQRLRGEARSDVMSFDDYLSMVNSYGYGGLPPTLRTTLSGNHVQEIPNAFAALAAHGQGSNAVVFSCMATRQFVFSAARFRWQKIRDGKPSDMFGTAALGILEQPWPGGTTQDLLSRLIQDADLAGNAYHVLESPLTRLGGDGGVEIVRLRPDWVDLVVTRRMRLHGQLGWRKVGYIYTEGGRHSGNDPVTLLPDEVAHFMPIPDPLAQFRGMSWLTPVVREIENDGLMSRHKRKYFENGATPNLIIKHAPGADRDAILAFQKRLALESGGIDNAYKPLNLYPGADATVVGSNMEQVDFKGIQGAGETRIAAAGGVPPVIVGLSEGLQAATYSNYAQARRRFGDGTIHPLWQNASGSLEPLLPDMGTGVRLWYDADDIPFLREDEKDSADIASTQASTIRSLVDTGYVPTSVVAAVMAGDWRLLEHTNRFSVQLQTPDQGAPEGVTA